MLQAKIDGKWGPLPDELKPDLPSDGTVLSFEFAHSHTDPMTGKKSWNNQEQLDNPILIKNPDPKKAPIQIGLINGVDQQNNPVADGVRRIVLYPKASAGLHHIVIGGSIEGDELAQFMLLSSQNESSKVANPGTHKVYRFKDFKADAEKLNKQTELEMEAMSLALSSKGATLNDLANLHGVSTTQDPAQIKKQLVDIAKKNPENFLALANDPDKDAKAVLGAALASGAVAIDAEKGLVNTINNTVLLPLTSTEREDASNEFAAHIRKDSKGAMTLKAIKTLTDQKLKTA